MIKKHILTLTALLLMAFIFAGNSNAQSNNEETDFFQSIFGMAKKEVVADFLKIESTNSFWALYDEYETKRKELGKERLNVLSDYVENYDKLTDVKYDEVVAGMISLRKSNDKLVDTYYKKIKKASGSKIAAQFFQLENYFLSEIRSTIMEEIPYIGEFDKK
jgi:F0F1-type ATP synthase delta subunit